jgi:hypothetical protein
MSNPSLNVYIANYYKSYGYGAFDELVTVVCANTETEALGLVLEENQNTVANGWTIELFDTNRKNVKNVHECC